jgi:hypothetical protein
MIVKILSKVSNRLVYKDFSTWQYWPKILKLKDKLQQVKKNGGQVRFT